MKDKEKQIEEMIHDLKIAMCSYESCEECPTSWCYAEECATMAICKGYRKLPEDSVVLSREEYNDFVESKRLLGCYIEDQKILLQRLNLPDPLWFCTFGGCEGICKECIDTCEMSIFVKERKETAEKILKLVKQKAWCYQEDENGKAWTYSITVTQLKELAKQFGVEIKE